MGTAHKGTKKRGRGKKHLESETRGHKPSRFNALALRHHPGCVSEAAQRWTVGGESRGKGDGKGGGG
jgi:RNA:NAD 2'-phosphotransferase (TPT1/KptA family)